MRCEMYCDKGHCDWCAKATESSSGGGSSSDSSGNNYNPDMESTYTFLLAVAFVVVLCIPVAAICYYERYAGPALSGVRPFAVIAEDDEVLTDVASKSGRSS